MKRSRGAGAAKKLSNGPARRDSARLEIPLTSTRPNGARDALSETRIRVPVPRVLESSLAPPPPRQSERAASRSILVVEREDSIAQDVESSLRRSGYEVVTVVVSGEDILAAVERHHPDLILMDVKLERSDDGIAAAAAIRTRYPIPIVFLASQSDDATLMRAKEEAQPHGFVLRPYHDTELRAAVEVALQRHRLEQEIRQQRSLLAGVLSGMSDAVVTSDAEGCIVLMNDAGRRAFGETAGPGSRMTNALVLLPDQETLCPDEEMPLARALRGERVRDQELFIRSPLQPEGRWYSINATPLVDNAGVVCGAVAVGRDVTDLRAARSQLEQLAETDALTGTYNRWGFMQVARDALEGAARAGSQPAVFFIDLNGMKRINDSLGHQEGDRLLMDVAAILRACFRTSDVVGRLGGDEFVVFAPDAGNNTEALRTRLRSAIDAFNAHSDRAYRISVSIGLGTGEPGKPPALEELVAQADRRMYEDKLLRNMARKT